MTQMYDILGYEEALWRLCLFLVLVYFGNVLLNSVWCVCPCVFSITLCSVVERWIVCHCTVFDIADIRMSMICSYHYRVDKLH